MCNFYRFAFKCMYLQSHCMKKTFLPCLRFLWVESNGPTDIEKTTVESLPFLAFADLSNVTRITCLEDDIHSVDALLNVKTTSKPIQSTMYTRNEHLRHDEVTDNNKRAKLLKPAHKIEESYYMSPPGNASSDLKNKTEERSIV